MTYPIAEMFYSVQGEGRWAGTPMFFIRLAGCTVGRYAVGHGSKDLNLESKLAVSTSDALKVLNKQHSICTTATGARFICDTDYHAVEKLSPEEILQSLPAGCERVCISGGEPFMHDLKELLEQMNERGLLIHVETSGTILPSDEVLEYIHWLCVSPKEGVLREMMQRADEVKLLVGRDTTLEELDDVEDLFRDPQFPFSDPTPDHIYLQPINSIDTVDQEMVQKCWEFLQQRPYWQLSAQLHKFLRMR